MRTDCEVKLAQRASTLDVPSSSQEVSEFDGLLRDDLRARAQSLGVTTHVGSKWRSTAELRRACFEKTKALQALPEAESVQAHHEAVDEEVSELGGLRRDDLRARAQSPTPADPRRSSSGPPRCTRANDTREGVRSSNERHGLYSFLQRQPLATLRGTPDDSYIDDAGLHVTMQRTVS